MILIIPSAILWEIMKYVLLTKDSEIVEATKGAFQPDDNLVITGDVEEALDACEGAEVFFVDQIATLTTPHRIAGYEEFADKRRAHPHAAGCPLVLIAPPSDYEIDSFVGWPGFVFAQLPRPITYKHFRRATTWT